MMMMVMGEMIARVIGCYPDAARPPDRGIE